MSPEQEEMLRRMEEEMRTISVQDVVTQSVVSILNLSARRIGKEDEQDFEQASLGISAVEALLPLLPVEPKAEVENALGQIKMMYAQYSGQSSPAPQEPPPGPAGGGAPGGGPQAPGGSGLWTPGG